MSACGLPTSEMAARPGLLYRFISWTAWPGLLALSMAITGYGFSVERPALFFDIAYAVLGLIGFFDSPFNKLAFDHDKSSIIAGFVTLAVIYFIGWELILAV